MIKKIIKEKTSHPEFALILDLYQSETQSTLYSLILVWGIIKAKHIVFLQLETR
jgi:hypothetical protein